MSPKPVILHTTCLIALCLSLASCAMLSDHLGRQRYIKETAQSRLPPHTEISVAYGTSPDQLVRVFIPHGGARRNVWLYLVHGGGWRPSPTQDLTWAVAALLEEGYAVALPLYRLVPEATGSAQVDDVDRGLVAATGVLRSEGYEAPVVLAGASAGAQLVSLTGRRALDREKDGRYPPIAGLALLSGVLDFSVCRNPIITRLLTAYAGQPGAPERDTLDPIRSIPQNRSFPVLCLFSDSDGTVESLNSRNFAEQWKKLNPDSTVYLTECPDLSHDEVYWYAFTPPHREWAIMLDFLAKSGS